MTSLSLSLLYTMGLLQWLCRIRLQCRRCGFDPWVGKIPWRRKWRPTPVLLPGKFHGLRSLVGYSPGVAKSRTRLSDFLILYSQDLITVLRIISLHLTYIQQMVGNDSFSYSAIFVSSALDIFRNTKEKHHFSFKGHALC